VTNTGGDILLQKRSLNKDVAPGKWDTSVGGHVDGGETIDEAVRREMKEELGIDKGDISFLYTYVHSNPYESEFVYSYQCTCEGPFNFHPGEIDEVKFWSIENIQNYLGTGLFSDNFEEEFARYMEHQSL
jgi:isopentenyldiphosphate isomerase